MQQLLGVYRGVASPIFRVRHFHERVRHTMLICEILVGTALWVAALAACAAPWLRLWVYRVSPFIVNGSMALYYFLILSIASRSLITTLDERS